MLHATRLDEAATATLAAHDADLGVVVAYGGLVREPLLSGAPPRLDQPALLAAAAVARAAPVQHALIAGDATTGAAVFRLEAGLDTGPLLAVEAVPIGALETAGHLLDRLAVIGARAARGAVDALAAGTAVAVPQQGEPTLAPKLDARGRPARLARSPPGRCSAAIAASRRSPAPSRRRRAAAEGARGRSARDAAPLPPGAVAAVGGRVLVGTGDGAVELVTVQPAGRTAMAAAAWLRGAARPCGSDGARTARSATVSPARRVALEVLSRSGSATRTPTCCCPCSCLVRASPAETAFATELAYGTLRRLGHYDAVIAAAAGREIAAIDPPLLDVLRLAAHQLLAHPHPTHAAVHQAVEQAREAAGRGAAGFANAVLRKVGERDDAAWTARLTAGLTDRIGSSSRPSTRTRPGSSPNSSRRSPGPTGATAIWRACSRSTTSPRRSASSPCRASRTPPGPGCRGTRSPRSAWSRRAATRERCRASAAGRSAYRIPAPSWRPSPSPAPAP